VEDGAFKADMGGDTFREDMQEMSVGGSDTHGDALGALSVTVINGDNSSLSLSKFITLNC